MKTINYKNALILSIVMLIPSFFLVAQDGQRTISKNYKWKGEEEKKETLEFEVLKSSHAMVFSLSAVLEKGELTVNLFDPEGRKIPGFHLESDGSDDGGSSVEISTGTGSNSTSISTSNSGSSSSTSISTSKGKNDGGSYSSTTSSVSTSGSKGVMNEVFTDPAPGKWKLVIKVEEATGQLEVQVTQDK